MATKKITTLYNELWDKELKRLKRFIKQAEKRGFSFPQYIIPQKPEKVTKKSLQLIQNITPSFLYKKGSYRHPDTGAILTGEQGRALERAQLHKPKAGLSTQNVKSPRTKTTFTTPSEKANPLTGRLKARKAKESKPDAPKKESKPKVPKIETHESMQERTWRLQQRRIRSIVKNLQKRGYIFESDVYEDLVRAAGGDIERFKRFKTKDLYKYAKYTNPRTGEQLSGEAGKQFERAQAARKAAHTRQVNKAVKEANEREVEAKKQRITENLKPVEKPKKQTKGRQKRALNQREKGSSTRVEDFPVQQDVIMDNVTEVLDKYPEYKRIRSYLDNASPNSWSRSWQLKNFWRNRNTFYNMLNGAILTQGEEEIAKRLEAHATEVLEIFVGVLYGSKDVTVQHEFARFSSILLGRALTPDEGRRIADFQEYFESED